MKSTSHWPVRKNLALLVVVSILPALVILLYSGLEQRRTLVENAEKDVLLRAHSLAEVQRDVTRATQQMLSTLALLPEIQTLDIEASSQILRAFIEKNPDYRNVTLTDPEGNVLASALPFSDVNLHESKNFRDAIANKSFAVGEYVVTKIGKASPGFTFAYPVLD